MDVRGILFMFMIGDVRGEPGARSIGCAINRVRDQSGARSIGTYGGWMIVFICFVAGVLHCA